MSRRKTCRFCGGPLNSERVKATGYTHCTEKNCVARWLAEQREDYRLDLIPKVGFGISKKDDPVARTIGRSSGKVA